MKSVFIPFHLFHLISHSEVGSDHGYEHTLTWRENSLHENSLLVFILVFWGGFLDVADEPTSDLSPVANADLKHCGSFTLCFPSYNEDKTVICTQAVIQTHTGWDESQFLGVNWWKERGVSFSQEFHAVTEQGGVLRTGLTAADGLSGGVWNLLLWLADQQVNITLLWQRVRGGEGGGDVVYVLVVPVSKARGSILQQCSP